MLLIHRYLTIVSGFDLCVCVWSVLVCFSLCVSCSLCVCFRGAFVVLSWCVWSVLVLSRDIQRVLSVVGCISVQYRYLSRYGGILYPVPPPILKRGNLGCLKILCIYFLL